MSNENFWNDDKVKEFVRWNFNRQDHNYLPAALKQFKQEQLSKRDWEIVSFIAKSVYGRVHERIYQKKEDGRFWYNDNPNHFPESFCLGRVNAKRHFSEEIWSIHSVRRLSDGEVFAVNNEVELFGNRKITKIEVVNNELIFVLDEQNKVDISSLRKSNKKVLLFLTEDGKDIFEGQSYAYTPRESLGWVNVSDGKSTPMPKDGFLYFSTKEKAEEYILRNKPLLSLQDLLNVWDIDDRFQKEDKEWYAQSPMFKTFQQLAKSKMDKK